jgi:hypothetical protein
MQTRPYIWGAKLQLPGLITPQKSNETKKQKMKTDNDSRSLEELKAVYPRTSFYGDRKGSPPQHTPGPWHVETEHPANVAAGGHELNSECRVLTTCGIISQSGDTLSRQKANARIIAAAPCLLSALRIASVLLWKNSKNLRSPNPLDIDEAFALMTAAISKATKGNA